MPEISCGGEPLPEAPEFGQKPPNGWLRHTLTRLAEGGKGWDLL